MAELVDALVLETGPFGGVGSSPTMGTWRYGGMVDTGDLKSPAVRRAGSNPATATMESKPTRVGTPC